MLRQPPAKAQQQRRPGHHQRRASVPEHTGVVVVVVRHAQDAAVRAGVWIVGMRTPACYDRGQGIGSPTEARRLVMPARSVR